MLLQVDHRARPSTLLRKFGVQICDGVVPSGGPIFAQFGRTCNLRQNRVFVVIDAPTQHTLRSNIESVDVVRAEIAGRSGRDRRRPYHILKVDLLRNCSTTRLIRLVVVRLVVDLVEGETLATLPILLLQNCRQRSRILLLIRFQTALVHTTDTSLVTGSPLVIFEFVGQALGPAILLRLLVLYFVLGVHDSIDWRVVNRESLRDVLHGVQLLQRFQLEGNFKGALTVANDVHRLSLYDSIVKHFDNGT